jgi:PKD repeat protein
MGVRRIELQEWENTYYGFGDSISAYDDMYVMQMVSKYDPVNGTASHNYDGSSMASWWGAGAFNTHPPSSHPGKYFTLIGVNDRVIDPTYGANQTADNLYAIYSGVASNGSTPYIVLYPARESAGTYSDQLDNMTKIKQRLDYHRVSYIMGYDAYDLLPGNNVFDDINYTSQPDGVHPSSAAHLLLADYVWDHLTPGSATFNQNQSSGALSISVLFTDTTDKNPTMWNWSFGDGTHSTEQNPIHTYDAGNYSVTLIAMNAGGSSTSTQNSWVNVSGPPTYLSEYDASRVLTLHMNQSPIHPTWFNDSSKNNLIFDTFGQATTTTSYKPFGNASGLFDGDGDYISTPKTSNLDLDVGERNYTILYWSKPTSGVGDKYYFELVNNSGYQSVLLESNSDTLFVLDRINATNTWYTFGTVDNSAGHQYVIQRISNKLYVYKDGVVQTLTPTAAGKDVGGLTKSIIGGANGILTSRYYNGSLDEYNVWKTDIPISKLYPQLYEVGQTIPSPITASFSSFNTAGTAPFTTYLYDTSTNLTGSETFGWVLGDGNTSTAKNLYFTWNKTGEYVVNHSVSNGVTTSYSQANITVGTPTPAVIAPVASFYGSPTTGNVPLTVSFTDVSSNTPTSWNWSFGDGIYSELQNPTHAYTRSGFRTVNLTATNSAGSNVTTRLKFVKVS